MVQVIKNAALAGHLKTKHSGKILSSPETTAYSTVSALTSKRILKNSVIRPSDSFRKGRSLQLSRDYIFRGGLTGPSPGMSWPTLGPRISVASNSLTTITPGTGSSITSTATVSTVGAMVFATARFLVLIVLFFDFALAPLCFAGFPRMDLTGLRVTLRLRTAARFLRLAMTVACSGGAPVSRVAGVV
jgi:hypothetical protein